MIDLHRRPAWTGRAVWLAAACMATPCLHAQTTACDLLKRSLATRIEATGVRGYSLEAVPVGDPTPADAKVIGTCSIGAYKVLYRRWASTGSASSPAGPQPAAVAPLSGASEPAAQATAHAPAPAPAQRAASEPSRRAPEAAAPADTSVPEPVPPPAHDLRDSMTPARSADAPVAPPRPEPARVTPAPRVQAHATPQATPLPQLAMPPPRAASPSSLRRAAVAVVSHWYVLVLALVFATMATAWLAHRSAYDKDGLPRGPKVRI